MGHMPSAIRVPALQTVSRRVGRVQQLQTQVETLLDRVRLTVIHGGDKSVAGAVIEPAGNPRSWKSYEPVARDIAGALGRLGCSHVCVAPDDMRLGSLLAAERSHLAWLNTGGVQGHCSIAHAPAMLELFGVPYIGHDPMMAAILDNKHVFKRQLRASGIPTADFYVWQPRRISASVEADPAFIAAFGEFAGPFIVKPISGRASLHVTFVDGRADLEEAIQTVYAATNNHVMVERYLGGQEYCVAVMGGIVSKGRILEKLDEPFVFSALERMLAPDERIFTSMDKRPITEDLTRVIDPVAEAPLLARLSALARRVFTELGVETLIRLDVRADEAGNLFVLEANPKPDLKAPAANVTSLVSIGLPDHGMDYDDLILSVFADRVDALLGQQRGTPGQLSELARIN